MTLAILGLGLVSPLGLTPAQHVFFARAEVGPAAPGAFLDADGETMNVAYCPWLGAELPVSDRLAALGAAALGEALAPLGGRAPSGLHVCTAAPRLGLADGDRGACEAALAGAARVSRPSRTTGEAGFFAALAQARERLERGAEAIAAVVAVDSLIAPPLLAGWRRAATTPWEGNLPRPAEAAAAIVLALPAEARRSGLPVLGTLHHAAVLRGEANDDNDAIIDGGPLTALLRAAAPGPFAAVFGQQAVGNLRRREWDIASARVATSFRPACVFTAVETLVGCVGAAAGAACFAFGAAAMRHRAFVDEPAEEGPLLAWSISRDGTRGLCTATMRG